MDHKPKLNPETVQRVVDDLDYATILEGAGNKLGILVTTQDGSQREVIFEFPEAVPPPTIEREEL